MADNDGGLTVSPRAVTVQEGSSGSSYTVALNRAPSGPVTLTLTTSPPRAVTATPGAQTYSTSSWEAGQAVTASDDADRNNETATVSHTAASDDTRFTFATAQGAENVTVRDDDMLVVARAAGAGRQS